MITYPVIEKEVKTDCVAIIWRFVFIFDPGKDPLKHLTFCYVTVIKLINM